MNYRLSDEAWAQTLPLTDGPVIRLDLPRVMEPPSFDSQTTEAAKCAQCGKTFRRMRSTAMYCGPNCRRRAYKGRE